jgi:hypothetical protein
MVKVVIVTVQGRDRGRCDLDRVIVTRKQICKKDADSSYLRNVYTKGTVSTLKLT